MKKSVKLLTCVSVAVVLVCLLAVSAFAAAQSGSFSVTVLGSRFTGNYNAALYVHSTYTDSTLNITNYTGLTDGGDAELEGTVYGVKADGTEVTLGSLYDRYAFDCQAVSSYSFRPGTYESLSSECTYYFMSKTLCSLDETLSLVET